MNILVLDDEAEIADLVELFLKNEGYNVYKFYSSSEAIKCINSTPLDLALLDVMLPDTDGFTILRKIREEGFRFPVIMLTAKVEDNDKIIGLSLGADDYITKPFNPLEMVSRVKAQLRRYTLYNGTEILENKDGVGVVEIILILVVLISLVVIFKSQLTSLVETIFEKITSESSGI